MSGHEVNEQAVGLVTPNGKAPDVKYPQDFVQVKNPDAPMRKEKDHG